MNQISSFSKADDMLLQYILLVSLDFDDFLIEYPIQQRQQIYLGPSLNQSCINITAIDDDRLEDEAEYLSLYLLEGDKSNAQVTNGVVQVVILDNDSECCKS